MRGFFKRRRFYFKKTQSLGFSISASTSSKKGIESVAPARETVIAEAGVTSLENCFKKIRIKPHLMGLTYAKGRVPTGYGYVDISWKKEADKFTLDVCSSKEVEMEIVMPSGKTETLITKEYSTTES